MQKLLDKALIPYVVITEPTIERIQEFPYLIMADDIHVTEPLQAALDRYQGELILIGRSLSQDAWGETSLTPPSEALSASDAVASIKTTPVRFVALEEGDDEGKGVFVELFKQADVFQIRLFDSVLDASFKPKRGKLTLQFAWQGETPKVSLLPFMGEAKRLTTTRIGHLIQVKVDVGLAAILTIQ